MSVFGGKLQELRSREKWTQEELAKRLGLSRSAIGMYEAGEREANFEIMEAIADIFNVDINVLYGRPSAPLHLSSKAQRIGRAYSIAPQRDQRTVEHVLEPYMDDNGNSAPPRNDTETAAELAPDIVDFESHISDLPLYTQSIAAGLGNYLDSDDYEMVGFSNVPHRANIAVRISGDSMEPLYHDGDIVFVETDSVLDAGEIGIFNYDNQGYIKKLMFNPPRLVSLNKKYPDIYITEHSPCYTIGRVLGRDN